MAEHVLKGRRSVSKARAPRVYTGERTCAMEDCSTKLSQYNRREYCFAHAPTKFPRLRGRIVKK